MEFLDAIKKLDDSEDIKRWKNDHPEMYLVHGFTMLGNNKEDPMNWQIGYYDTKHDKITPIELGIGINIGAPQQAFKKNESIDKLNLEKVKITAKKAIDEAEKIRLEKYTHETPAKIFIVIQNLRKEGQVWNITIATKTMNTINIKIDAETGEIKSVKTENFIQVK